MEVKYTDFNDNNKIKILVNYPVKTKAEWVGENQELRIIIDRLLLDKKNMIKQLNLIAERLKNKEMNDE
jgi:hypothetical protein